MYQVVFLIGLQENVDALPYSPAASCTAISIWCMVKCSKQTLISFYGIDRTTKNLCVSNV